MNAELDDPDAVDLLRLRVAADTLDDLAEASSPGPTHVVCVACFEPFPVAELPHHVRDTGDLDTPPPDACRVLFARRNRRNLP